MMKNSSPFRVLIVEDNLPDVNLLRFLFGNCPVATILDVARDGAEACDRLFRRKPFREAELPELILLDLNTPLKDGRQVLREIKQDPHLRLIPVIMVTTSSSEREILDSYTLGASAFISKPVDVKAFQVTINKLVNFWFECVTLPSRITG